MHKILILIFSAMIAFVGCTESGDDVSVGGDDDNGGNSDGSTVTTDCGIVVGGSLTNPTGLSSGTTGTATAAGPNRVIVSSATGSVLVKLQGIDNFTGTRADAALSRLRSLLSGQVTYFEAVKGCTTTDAGGVAVVGQVVNSSGVSVAEDLLQNGLIPSVDQNDECSGNLVGSCLEALREVGEQSGEAVSNFLWKPESERTGKLAILFSPAASSVTVNGDTCNLGSGATNGRSTTARCPRSGCEYGSNARVSAIDTNGRPLLFQGSTEYIIADGCQRIEF